jgi:crotonobetainyl-CoA hydratase
VTVGPVRSERHDHTLLITIDRPEVLNAIDAATSQQLGDVVEGAATDPEVWALVLTGAGARSFCAGADLKSLAAGELPYSATHPEWGFAGFCTHPISKPIVAAVNGLALGGGLELMLASDLVVAHRDARIGLPEVRRGIIASGGGVVRLPEQLPPKVALNLILTGEVTTAGELGPWGLVNELVDDVEAVVPAALALADRICANAPLAVQASKRVALGIIGGRQTQDEAQWEASRSEAAAIRETQDAVEGPLAFIEKRAPHWKGI